MATVFKRGGARAKGPWYIQWIDHTGKRRSKCARTTDKATAERIARKHEADAALRRDGVIDPTLDAISKESQRTIEAHLADYESKLRTAGRTEKHITSTRRFIEWVADHAEFTTLADITADGVNRYAGKLRDEGRAVRTIQAHLNAIKAFTKWLTDHHKLPRDPLSSVKKPNPAADRRRERRMLPPEALRATGTDGLPTDDPKGAQHSQRERGQSAASPCDDQKRRDAQKKTPKPLQIADLGDGLRDCASLDASSGGGIRTPDTRIMIPLL